MFTYNLHADTGSNRIFLENYSGSSTKGNPMFSAGFGKASQLTPAFVPRPNAEASAKLTKSPKGGGITTVGVSCGGEGLMRRLPLSYVRDKWSRWRLFPRTSTVTVTAVLHRHTETLPHTALHP
jgi:hypothetical protein